MNSADAYLSPVNPEHLQFLTLLQLKLETYYDIEPPYCIGEFVCHSAQSHTGSSSCKGSTQEMLVYREDKTNLDISLFLNPSLLSNLCEDTYSKNWMGSMFDNGCIVLEGVSHFLYIIFNAHFNRPVSQLDLHIQANIDKFLFSVLDTEYSHSPENLLHRLFGEITYHDDLCDSLRQRYQQANELAHSYCHWLNNNFELRRDNKSLLAEIGKIYRKNGTAKQLHIQNLATPIRMTG